MQGCGATYFCPGELVPREDMAVALVRAMRGSTITPGQPAAGPANDVAATYCLAGFIKISTRYHTSFIPDWSRR